MRAIAAVFIGSLIGNERAKHGRAAGMRTHILVCLGACMTSLTSMYVSNVLGNNGDIFRAPAQVISGIGFLGAGMIILKSNNIITGLTTAAGVWATGTIGVALGYGYYTGAFIVTFLLLTTITLFARFERQKKSAEVIYIEIDDAYQVNRILKELETKIEMNFSYQIFAPKSGCAGNVGINIVLDKNLDIETLKVSELENVVFVIEE